MNADTGQTGRFAGRVAVVTGASSGIGRAVAVALSAGGADLALTGRDAGALRDTVDLCAQTRRALFYPLDLTDDEAVRQLGWHVRNDFHRVDLLVHAAGFAAPGAMESAPVEELDRHYRINVRVPYALTQELLPEIRQHRGQIVFVNSSAGLSGRAGLSQYAASKHALKGLADSLRQEINADGVRVLSVFVGRTATPMQAALHRWEGRDYAPADLLQPGDVAEAVLQGLSLPPTAEATDVHVRPMVKSSPNPRQLAR